MAAHDGEFLIPLPELSNSGGRPGKAGGSPPLTLDLPPWEPPKSSDLQTAQGRLALFLRNLAPLFRRLITGVDMTGFEALDLFDLPAADRTDFLGAQREYRRHVAAVDREFKRWRGRESVLRNVVLEDFLDVRGVRERSFRIASPRRGGRPRVPIDERADVKLLLEVQEKAIEMQPLWDEFQTRKKRGKDEYRGSPEVIRDEFVDEGNDLAAAEAITESKTLTAAAARLVGRAHSQDHRAVQASIARARKLLRDSTD